jgi:hypothetical protein
MAKIEHSEEWMAGWNAAIRAMERRNERLARITIFERYSLLSEHNLDEMTERRYQEYPELRPPLQQTARRD